MKIIQLEYFCAVCRYHSITQAAQKLYVTQPAISNAIRELEKEFSDQPVQHGQRTISLLTKEGEAFYQKASVHCSDNIHETNLLKALRSGKAGCTDPHRYSAAFEHCLLSRICCYRLLQKAYPHTPVWNFLNTGLSVRQIWYRKILMDLALVNLQLLRNRQTAFLSASSLTSLCSVFHREHPPCQRKRSVPVEMLKDEPLDHVQYRLCAKHHIKYAL